jgi:hypothetical protein
MEMNMRTYDFNSLDAALAFKRRVERNGFTCSDPWFDVTSYGLWHVTSTFGGQQR